MSMKLEKMELIVVRSRRGSGVSNERMIGARKCCPGVKTRREAREEHSLSKPFLNPVRRTSQFHRTHLRSFVPSLRAQGPALALCCCPVDVAFSWGTPRMEGVRCASLPSSRHFQR